MSKTKGRTAGRAASRGEIEGLGLVRPSRHAPGLGLLIGLVAALIFVFPSRAYPLESLILSGLIGLSALVLCLRGLILRPAAMRAGLGHVGLTALGLFALWALIRWQSLRVPLEGDPAALVAVTSPGRPLAVAYLMMAVAALLGFSLSLLGDGAGATAWAAFRRVLTVAAIAFALLAFYQFVYGYERTLEAFGAESGDDAMSALMRQSLEHALRERRVGGRLGNGNLFAALLATLAGLSLAGLGERAGARWRWPAAAAWLLASCAVLLTRSRGGLLTLILATALALLLLRRSTGRWWGWGLRAGSSNLEREMTSGEVRKKSAHKNEPPRRQERQDFALPSSIRCRLSDLQRFRIFLLPVFCRSYLFTCCRQISIFPSRCGTASFFSRLRVSIFSRSCGIASFFSRVWDSNFPSSCGLDSLLSRVWDSNFPSSCGLDSLLSRVWNSIFPSRCGTASFFSRLRVSIFSSRFGIHYHLSRLQAAPFCPRLQPGETEPPIPQARFSAASRQGFSRPKFPFSFPPAFIFTSVAFLLFLSRQAYADGLWSRLTKVSTIRERFNYWSIALEVWSMDWLFGAGPGAFMLYYPQFKPPTARESRFAHSWIFQIGSETGWLGLALIAIFLATALSAALYVWKSLARRKHDAQASCPPAAREAGWLALGVATLGFNGLFEFSLQLQEFLVLLGLMGGGLLGLVFQMRFDPERDAVRRPARRQAGFFLGLFAFVACGTAAAMLVPRLQAATFYEWQARALAADGQYKRAADYYRRAAEWAPDEAGYVAGRAISLAMTPGALDEALELFQRAERMNPLSAALRRDHAQLLERAGRPVAALKKYDEAVALYPHDAGHRLARAEAHLQRGNAEAARTDLNYIDEHDLPLWEYQRPDYERLRRILRSIRQKNHHGAAENTEKKTTN